MDKAKKLEELMAQEAETENQGQAEETQAQAEEKAETQAETEAADAATETQPENQPENQDDESRDSKKEEDSTDESPAEVIKVQLGEEEVELPIQLITAVKDGSLEQDYRVFMKIAEAAEKDEFFRSYLESVVRGESEKFHTQIVKADFSQLGFNPPQELVIQAMRSTKEPDPVKAVKKYLNISDNPEQAPEALSPERRVTERVTVSKKDKVRALTALLQHGDAVDLVD